MFKAILEQLLEGVIIIDDNDEIVFVNRTAEEIRHVSKEKLVGRSVVFCHPQKSHERVARALQYLKRGKDAFRRMVVDHEKGKFYENTYAAVRGAAGDYLGSVVITRDITDRRKLEEERTSCLLSLEEKVAELEEKMQRLLVSSMASLVNALEAKDPYTQSHSVRVGKMAVKIAEHVWGVCPEARNVELAGELHDIGKVGIREVVLNKPGRLTDEEYSHIKEHPVIGEKILSPVNNMKSVARLVRHHHERFDGYGYPDGLKGEEIPEGSRILAVADSYDAMITERPYRPALAPERAAGEIKKNLGTQFDPQWGEIFLELFYSGSIG